MATQSKQTRPATSNGKSATKVPARLATPTDLASADVVAITKALNGLVADAFTLYIKVKNFHWHLSGVHFRDLHLLFDEHAAAIFGTIDPLAERVRRIGGLTVHSIGQIGQLASIADDDELLVAPVDMVARLLQDNQRMAEAMRAAHELCEESKDAATSGLLENFIDETERRIWFLFEIHQGLHA